MIQFISEDVQPLDLERNKISRWIHFVAAQHGKKAGNINYIFCSDKKMLEVNNQFLRHDYYTDIITFDYSIATKIAGDIFISIETVESNAQEQKTHFNEELTRIMIHGILHLCGQNDKNPTDKQEMTRKENEALKLLEEI